LLSEIWQIFQKKRKRKEKLFELSLLLKDPTASQKKKKIS
jgi:hypothetical protein